MTLDLDLPGEVVHYTKKSQQKQKKKSKKKHQSPTLHATAERIKLNLIFLVQASSWQIHSNMIIDMIKIAPWNRNKGDVFKFYSGLNHNLL